MSPHRRRLGPARGLAYAGKPGGEVSTGGQPADDYRSLDDEVGDSLLESAGTNVPARCPASAFPCPRAPVLNDMAICLRWSASPAPYGAVARAWPQVGPGTTSVSSWPLGGQNRSRAGRRATMPTGPNVP